jgi:hypothetical protein
VALFAQNPPLFAQNPQLFAQKVALGAQKVALAKGYVEAAAVLPSLPLDSLLALATNGTQEGEGLGVGSVLFCLSCMSCMSCM